MSFSANKLYISAGALFLAVGLTGCDKPTDDFSAAGPREVRTLAVKTEPFTLIAELPGRVEPVRIAEVRARVPGIVLSRAFEEGADVNAGDLLFQIDPAPYKVALSRAQGGLAKAEAEVYQALATVKRYDQLVEIEAISQQEYDVAKANLQTAKAAKLSAQADVESAKLNLGYAAVRAPISGRIGRALITEGALVGQDEATLLTRIQQLDPVYVDFTQTAADALQLRAAIAEGRVTGAGEQPLSLIIEGTDLISKGTLLFADVSVDRNTGQITLRGSFDNPDRALLPGMYVRVRTPQSQNQNAILVPQRAVQRSSDGQANVMVIGSNHTAETRPVKTGVMQGSRWQIIDGLKPGEQVIVSSLSSIRNGDKVAPARDVAQAQTATQPTPL